MINLNDIISVSEKLETPFFYEKNKFTTRYGNTHYANMYKEPKRGSKGLEAWLVKNPYLTLTEWMMLISSPIKDAGRFWYMPGHVLFDGVFSDKPGLRKILRKI